MINPAHPALADYFRALGEHDSATMISIPGPVARMLADAIELADSLARSDIECNITQSAEGWYDTTEDAEENEPWLPQAMRHLDARGMIERDATWPHVIRFIRRPS